MANEVKEKNKILDVDMEETTTHPLAVVRQAEMPRTLPCGNLAKALAMAQQKCHAVQKDKENTFHKYDYASGEAIIQEAKAALSDCELALMPVEQTLDGHSKEGEARFELVRKFLLMHSSGESMPIVVHWPVVPDRGRPLDKATASAATTSLAYLLRDLLLMPRVDEETEMDHDSRDRAKAAPNGASKPAPPKAAPPAPPPKPAAPNGAGWLSPKEKILEIHHELTTRKKTWADALKHCVGIQVGDNFTEPRSPNEAETVIGELIGDTPNTINTVHHKVVVLNRKKVPA